MKNAMVKQEFTALFKGYTIPKELKSLYEFQQSENIPSYYSNAIYLIDEQPGNIESISNDSDFINSFIPFADADANGSVYAFWIRDNKQKAVDNMPIVIFGDEGGVFPVANNLQELLQIAAYDVEPSVFEDEFNFPDKEILEEDGEYFATEFNKEYLDWLRKEAKLKPILVIEGIDKIVALAQKNFGTELEEFIQKYK
ncbi:SMI1/KNR4 family protein [Myroides sp. LJL119]